MIKLKPLKIASKKLIFLALISVAIFASLVGAAYFLSEQVNQRQHQIATWLSNKLGHPVDIEAAQLRWSGLAPKLQFGSLTILEQDRKTALLSLKQVYFDIDWLTSIWRRNLAFSQITLTKVNSAVSRDKTGQFKVQGFNLASGLSSSSDHIDWLTWVGLLNRFNLQALTIDYTDDRDSELSGRYQFNDVIAYRDGKKWLLQGDVTLPMALETTEFQVKLDMDSHDLKKTAWQFELNNIHISSQKLAALPIKPVWQDVMIKQGKFKFALSMSGQGNRIDNIHADVDMAALLASKQAKNVLTVPVERLTGKFDWQRQKDGWRLSADNVQLVINGDKWPSTHFVIDSEQGEWSIAGHYLRLSDLTAIMLLAGDAPDIVRYQKPAGDIANFRLRYAKQDGLIALAFNLRGGVLLPWQDFPGVTGLTMGLNWDKAGANIDIDSHQVSLYPESVLDDAIFFDTVKGKVALQQASDGWLVNSPDFQLRNDDLVVQLAGSMAQNNSGHRHADLVINMEEVDLNKWRSYLPQALLSDNFKNWFSQALLDGRIANGKIVLKGDVASFPYKKPSEGVFNMMLQVQDVQLNYAPKWPKLSHVSGTITTTDTNRLVIKSKTGLVAGFDFSDVTATIARLTEDNPILHITGDITGKTNDALNFLAQSPLKERFGSVASKVAAKGNSDIKLNLYIPLAHPDNLNVAGTVSFVDSYLYATSLADMGLSNINGDMQFSNHGVAASAIDAKFLSEPVAINIATKEATTVVSMDGKMVVEKVNAIWQNAIPDYISGATHYQAGITISEKKIGDFYVDVDVSSDLIGLAVAAPKPIAKTKEEDRLFKVALKHIDNHSVYSASYDKWLHAVASSDSDKWRGEIRLGGEQADMPESGIKLRGQLAALSLDNWLAWLKQQQDADNQWLPYVNHVDVTIDSFTAFSQQLKALTVLSEKDAQGWQINVDSDKIKGVIFVPEEGFNNGSVLKMDLDKAILYFPKTEDRQVAEETKQPSTTLWPSLAINIDLLKINDIAFGQFDLKGRREQARWLLDSAHISSSLFTGSASAGSWHKSESGDISRIKLAIESDDLAELLANFGYQRAIESQRLSLDMDIAWQGYPLAVSSQNIAGALTMEIGSGSLKDVDPNVAERIFGLLSIVALPRRLSLDFRDLFAKGFTFNSISGSFKLADGVAKTDDFVLKSAPAIIEIKGPVDLVNKRYDQKVKVTPNIASTLPVAGLVFGPAGSLAGTAIMLLDKLADSVLDKEIVNRISYHYYLTGSWHDPKLSVSKPPSSP